MGTHTPQRGPPRLTLRTLIALLYLKHAFNESDQGVEELLLQTAHAKLVQAAKEAGVPLK